LKFIELFTAKPHVFISFNHPLAKKESISLEDLKENVILGRKIPVGTGLHREEDINLKEQE